MVWRLLRATGSGPFALCRKFPYSLGYIFNGESSGNCLKMEERVEVYPGGPAPVSSLGCMEGAWAASR